MAQPTTSTQAQERTPLESDRFRSIIGHFASGVTVITASQDGQPKGTTASAMTSLSLEPPMVLVCLNRTSATGETVRDTGRFAVNILAEEQVDEAMRFAGKKPNKFEGTAFHLGLHDVPLLDGALATLECEVTEVATGGTHYVFLAAVEQANARDGAPLAYFKGRFGRLEMAQDDDAFAELRAAVLSRRIEAGKPLDLDEVAARFEIPRGSVYHALSRLIGEGMVGRDADGAFVVRPLTPEGVADAWRARCAIELGVADLAAANCDADADAVAELRRLAEESAPGDRDSFSLESWLAAYGAFHERFVELGSSGALTDAYRRVNAPAAILSVTLEGMTRTGQLWDQCAAAHRQHVELVEALAAGDAAAARAVIVAHEQLAGQVAQRFIEAGQ